MSVKSVTLAVAVAVLSAGAALAQGWFEYTSRDEFFLISMPAQPQITTTTYRAASGAMLPATVFTATEGPRRYTVTVVHFMNASAADEAAAIEQAVQNFRSRPGAQVTYDGAQLIEGLPAHMIYLLNPDQSRTAAGVVLHPKGTGLGGPGRFYILEGTVPPGMAPAIQFPQSFFFLDEAGTRLDFTTNQAGQRVRNNRAAVSVAGVYGAREPVMCPARKEPAQGKPSAAQVAQYIKCTVEGIADGTLFLIDNIQVREIGDGEKVDADYFPDLDASRTVYPIRGSMVRYLCEREGRNVPWGRADKGANCMTQLEANARGTCYKTTSGDWSCDMSDLVPVKTPRVAPPK